ncbi:hypothetical protein JTE90_007913 [Oedothorax gibbosus]|uniref:Uncharacterized protein n=1 Tax=Oedothorax gibbosus TaxID=931172 RepID=A0AAV6VHD8_9ARAC|nr:hypothetical protein JTE90_007913 [Oedothorax gibbosus]
MAASHNLSENTVIYRLFCSNNGENSNNVSHQALELLSEDYLSKISGFLHRYIWQNDPFNLRIVDSVAESYPSHLEGISSFEDNIEDEWFIVYLLFYLSERDKNLVIQIQDNDGDFLLIEAAEHLPKWLNPDTSENRVFIYQGAIHIIPIARSPAEITPLPSGTPNISDALSVLRQYSSSLKVPPAIQEAVKRRIKDYPHKIDENKHRAHCYVPCTVAAILKEDPFLLPHAVKAFYLRDPIDLKACRAMKYFAPETRVMTEVTFTRCLYAQLSSQKFEPDKRTGWNLPEVGKAERKSHELGMKLACGFEILASNVEKMMQDDNTEHDFCNDVRWRRFSRSLKDKGYFRDEVEGSQMHSRLLLQAKDFYLSSLKQDENGNVNPGLKIHKFLRNLTVNYEEMKEAEKTLRPADDDSWMDITPDILDSMLEKMSQEPSEPEVAEAITSGLKSFVQGRSDLEGVEPPQKSKKQKINFDPDAFTDAVNAILDFRIPNSDDDASSSSMSGYSDDDDDDVALSEGNQAKYNVGSKGKMLAEMKDYLDDMDRELAKTTIGLSFERLPPRATIEEEDKSHTSAHDQSFDINEAEDDFRPVDVNLTALKNILESYSSQQGMPGPVSSLFSSLGMAMPDNIDS